MVQEQGLHETSLETYANIAYEDPLSGRLQDSYQQQYAFAPQQRLWKKLPDFKGAPKQSILTRK